MKQITLKLCALNAVFILSFGGTCPAPNGSNAYRGKAGDGKTLPGTRPATVPVRTLRDEFTADELALIDGLGEQYVAVDYNKTNDVSGIGNLGNTCYLAAGLNIFMVHPGINNDVLMADDADNEAEAAYRKSLLAIENALRLGPDSPSKTIQKGAKEGTVMRILLQNVLDAMTNIPELAHFANGQQHDTKEWSTTTLQVLRKDSHPPLLTSIQSVKWPMTKTQNMTGTYVRGFSGPVDANDQTIWTIRVENHSDFDEVVEGFSAETPVITGQGVFRIERSAVTVLPKAGLIHFERYTRENGVNKLTQYRVKFSEQFNVSIFQSYTSPSKLQYKKTTSLPVNAIGAVIHHTGGDSVEGGHYTAYTKGPTGWRNHDDSHVSDVDLAVVGDAVTITEKPQTEKEIKAKKKPVQEYALHGRMVMLIFKQ